MSGPPRPPAGGRSIEERYGTLAATGENLSCGATLAAAGVRPGERVVDLGCGRGAELGRAAACYGPTGLGVGVDRTPAMLVAASRTIVPDGPRWFVRGDLERLPLASASCDVVLSSCAINHARDKLAVYREIARILRPGGRFVVADIVAEQELPPSVREDPEAVAGCWGGAIPEAELRAILVAAGFPEPELLRRSEVYERHGVQLRSLTLRGSKAAWPPGPPGRHEPRPIPGRGGTMANLELSQEELKLLALSLEHCLATCKHAQSPCPDCERARALLARIHEEQAP